MNSGAKNHPPTQAQTATRHHQTHLEHHLNPKGKLTQGLSNQSQRLQSYRSGAGHSVGVSQCGRRISRFRCCWHSQRIQAFMNALKFKSKIAEARDARKLGRLAEEKGSGHNKKHEECIMGPSRHRALLDMDLRRDQEPDRHCPCRCPQVDGGGRAATCTWKLQPEVQPWPWPRSANAG